jgi:two-component system, sporulation sensor kinase A
MTTPPSHSTPPTAPSRETHALLEALPHAIIILDTSGNICWVNSAACRLYERQEQQLLGIPMYDCPVFNYVFRHEIISVLNAQRQWTGDSERVLPNGAVRYVHAHWSALDHAVGAGFIGMECDIAERKAMETELLQSRKLAKIGILSDGIAHELRNPLSYALSAAQLLSDNRLPDDVREKCLHTIITGLQKSSLIVENLLSLGKPAGRFTPKPVSIPNVVGEALDAASTHANLGRVSIATHFPQQPLVVHGNHDMLVQVLYNVITNALNEMPDGGDMTIRASEHNEQIRIRITDSGPGVSEEKMRHLFDPFYSDSGSGKGTGLGLTLSHFIMKEHHGSIEVESAYGKGATFILTFFRKDEEKTEPLV